MNIYKFALDMEKDGEKFYKELSGKTNDPGIQKILKMLENEEVKHHRLLETLSKNETNIPAEETDILENAKNVFSQMSMSTLKLNSQVPETELFQMARDLEEKSYRFFLDTTKKAETDDQRKIFLKLAEEEKKHMVLLENMVEFISRPENWLENAEFNHMEEY